MFEVPYIYTQEVTYRNLSVRKLAIYTIRLLIVNFMQIRLTSVGGCLNIPGLEIMFDSQPISGQYYAMTGYFIVVRTLRLDNLDGMLHYCLRAAYKGSNI